MCLGAHLHGRNYILSVVSSEENQVALPWHLFAFDSAPRTGPIVPQSLWPLSQNSSVEDLLVSNPVVDSKGKLSCLATNPSKQS